MALSQQELDVIYGDMYRQMAADHLPAKKPTIERAEDFLTKYVPAYAQSARTARVDFAEHFRQTER